MSAVNVGDVAADNIAAALADLEPFLNDDRRATATHLRSRLQANHFRVLVVGEAKRGKSTFVNALIGRDVLPMGVLPVTALVTTLVGESPEGVRVTFADGRCEQHLLTALTDFVTEAGNPSNRRRITSVTAAVDSPLLAGGLQLVDTPGTGSIYEHNSRAAGQALDDADAAIFVFSSDPPISAAELQLLAAVRQRTQLVFFVLNKIDYLTPDDARRVHEFTVRTLRDVTGGEVELYECSASQALAGRRSGDADRIRLAGVAACETAFRARVDAVRDDVLPQSIAAHALRLVQAQLDEAELAVRVRRLRAADEQHRVETFEHSLDAAVDRRKDLRTLVTARRQLLVEQLATESERFRRRLLNEVIAGTDEFAGDDEQLALGPRELERAGHAHAAEAVRNEIETWQDRQTIALQAELRALATLLAADVNSAVEAVREAGRIILDVDLALLHDAPQLPALTRFQFDFREDAGPTELLAGTLRRWLPGRLGRRRAIDWLGRDSADLVERHVGRARADLLDRLKAACDSLVETTVTELGSIIDVLRNTINDARLSSARRPVRAEEEERLGDAIRALRALRDRLSTSHQSAAATQQSESVP